MATPVQRFEATLEKLDPALGWTVVRIPFEPAKVWKTMIRLRVQGIIEGHAFRSSLFPMAGGGFFLLVNRAMQAATGTAVGSVARFELSPDLEPRPAELPDELAALLDEEPGLRGWYETLSEYTRREIGKWINGVKTDEARMRRVEQMAERLLATMDAERELPPVVQRAFRGRPKAQQGWKKMTATQRRNELLAVFYYRTPESRQKRIDKLIATAENASS